MGSEIERKFLVREDAFEGPAGTSFRQGYLPTSNLTVTRVRVAGDKAWLTIKGGTKGIERLEFEYEIPTADAEQMLDELCEKPLVEKTRYMREHAGHTWEIDRFQGDNAGLLIAEVELQSADEKPELPDWILREVSDEPRYFNSSLVKHPYSQWSDEEKG